MAGESLFMTRFRVAGVGGTLRDLGNILGGD
jgi:hypothetical protein